MKHLKDVIKESLYRTTKEQQTTEQKSVNTSIEKEVVDKTIA